MMSWSLTIRDFVRAHKYKTEAEKFGWSFVFQDFVSVELKSKVTETIKVSIFPKPIWYPFGHWWILLDFLISSTVCPLVVANRKGFLETGEVKYCCWQKKAPNPRADCKPWCGSSHSSPQDQGLASKSVWTSRWSKWAGTTRWPSAAGGTDGCPRRRSGSGLPAGGCRVRGLARRDLPTALGRSRYRLGLGMV